MKNKRVGKQSSVLIPMSFGTPGTQCFLSLSCSVSSCYCRKWKKMKKNSCVWWMQGAGRGNPLFPFLELKHKMILPSLCPSQWSLSLWLEPVSLSLSCTNGHGGIFPVCNLGSVLCQLNGICCLQPLQACSASLQPSLGLAFPGRDLLSAFRAWDVPAWGQDRPWLMHFIITKRISSRCVQ